MKVLIDAQLPPALVETFAINGVEAVHVTAVGLVAAADREIWDYALESRYSIATKDEDFFSQIGGLEFPHPLHHLGSTGQLLKPRIAKTHR